MIVLNLVIGVIMNSMDESNAEMAIKQEILKRETNPEALRDSMHDLQCEIEKISQEMKVIKKNDRGKQMNFHLTLPNVSF